MGMVGEEKILRGKKIKIFYVHVFEDEIMNH
jgi:hypothetical protein